MENLIGIPKGKKLLYFFINQMMEEGIGYFAAKKWVEEWLNDPEVRRAII